MPKRSNLFQQVITTVYEHIAGEAEIEHSAELINRATGKPREVDAVIRLRAAGHEALVKIEVQDRSRPADSTDVERLLGKHQNLPPGTLVFVSEKGFYKPARELAIKEGIAPVAPEDLTSEDFAGAIVNSLPAIFPKGIALTPTDLVLVVETPDGKRLHVKDAPLDVQIFDISGLPHASAIELFAIVFDRNFRKVADDLGLADITEDLEQYFTMRFGSRTPGEKPWVFETAVGEMPMFVQWGEVDPPQLHKILFAEFRGKAKIAVATVELKHRKIDGQAFSYGEAVYDGKPRIVVITENVAGEGKFTIGDKKS